MYTTLCRMGDKTLSTGLFLKPCLICLKTVISSIFCIKFGNTSRTRTPIEHDSVNDPKFYGIFFLKKVTDGQALCLHIAFGRGMVRLKGFEGLKKVLKKRTQRPEPRSWIVFIWFFGVRGCAIWCGPAKTKRAT